MGQFSYKCKACGRPIKNNKDNAVLIRIKNGKVKEKQFGIYDGYGRAGGCGWSERWGDIVNDHFSGRKDSGISAYHESCYKNQRPKTISEDDPKQGC